MKIASLTTEIKRATTAVAQFLVRVVLDGPVSGCEIKGRLLGPRCPGITTIEIAYPLVPIEYSETTKTFIGVIPEPNLWTPEARFVYELAVEVWVEGKRTDTRTSALSIRDRT
jgi:hypothetical protein